MLVLPKWQNNVLGEDALTVETHALSPEDRQAILEMTQQELQKTATRAIVERRRQLTPGPFSPQQIRVLQYRAGGKHWNEIAREMGISKWTVKGHLVAALGRIRNQVDVWDTHQTVLLAWKKGWIY